MKRKILSACMILSILAAVLLPGLNFGVQAVDGDDAWDPTSFAVIDDGDFDCDTAYAINPAVYWHTWTADEASQAAFGGEWTGFKSYNVGIDNQYFLYECRPGASVALTVLYKQANASLGSERDTKIYTSADLAEWTEVTGSNYKKKVDNTQFGDGSLYRVWFGVGAIPATDRYVKFCLPQTDIDDFAELEYFVDSFLMSGGSEPLTHANDAHYFYDSLNDVSKIHSKSEIEWEVITYTYDPSKELKGEVGDYIMWPRSLGANYYIVYQVAKNSTVVLGLIQSQYSGKVIGQVSDNPHNWLTNSALNRPSSKYQLEQSADGVNWTPIPDSAMFESIFPNWHGTARDQDGNPTVYQDWKAIGFNRRFIKTTLTGDNKYVRITFPAAPELESKNGTLSTAQYGYQYGGLTSFEAYSDDVHPKGKGATISTDGMAKLRFFTNSPAILPNGATVVAYGTLMIPNQYLTKSSEKYKEDAALVIGNAYCADARAEGDTLSDFWYARLSNSENYKGVRIAARSYVIYLDGNGYQQVAYGNVVIRAVYEISYAMAAAIVENKAQINAGLSPDGIVWDDNVPENTTDVYAVGAEEVHEFVLKNVAALQYYVEHIQN